VSNPGAGLKQEALAYGLRIDNAKPDLAVQKTEVQDGKLVIEGMASDNVSVAEIACQVDEKWRGATPLDGAYDGQYEQFRIAIALDKNGAAEVPIRVRDTAGNVATKTVTWPLESAKAKPKEETRPRK